ncbi:hypothetical protein [Nitrosomonas sp. HPC101]|uniref:hypothetical protein n=1 Tax=Nitrosomonas sp. HPC101 TaxID=1658667 RepID=UPI0031F5B62D
MSGNAAGSGIKGAADHLQQRGFATAVFANDADGFPFFYFKRYILECPEFSEVLRGLSANSVSYPGQDELLEPISRGVVDLVALGKIADSDGDVILLLVHGVFIVHAG